MSKRQSRRSVSVSTECYALLRKLAETPTWSGVTWQEAGTVPGSCSSILEILVRTEAKRLGVVVTSDDVRAALCRTVRAPANDDPVADLRAIEEAFNMRRFS